MKECDSKFIVTIPALIPKIKEATDGLSNIQVIKSGLSYKINNDLSNILSSLLLYSFFSEGKHIKPISYSTIH